MITRYIICRDCECDFYMQELNRVMFFRARERKYCISSFPLILQTFINDIVLLVISQSKYLFVYISLSLSILKQFWLSSGHLLRTRLFRESVEQFPNNNNL